MKIFLIATLLLCQITCLGDNLIDDVVMLHKESISKEIIKNYISTKSLRVKLTVKDIITLKKENVDDEIVNILINKGNDGERIQYYINNYDKINEYNEYVNFQNTHLVPRTQALIYKHYFK